MTADRLAAERVRRLRPRRLQVDSKLRAVVIALLGQRWTPEQVAQEPRSRFPNQRERQLSPESIYQAIYDPQPRSRARPSVDDGAGMVGCWAWSVAADWPR